MAQTVAVIPGSADLTQLAAIVADPTRALKRIQRARIVLLSAEHLTVLEVAQRTCVGWSAVLRRQQRYTEDGVEDLLRDNTQSPGKPPPSTGAVAKVLVLTCPEPPGEVTHCTGRALADAVGISLRSVRRIWDAHHLQPHRMRSFKRSTDLAFAAKVEDIVGLYMDPPHHAVVLSLDEKTQIQALKCMRPSRCVKPGRPETQTPDHVRHGTTTLFAALTAVYNCFNR